MVKFNFTFTLYARMLAVYFSIGDLRMRLAVSKKVPTWTVIR